MRLNGKYLQVWGLFPPPKKRLQRPVPGSLAEPEQHRVAAGRLRSLLID